MDNINEIQTQMKVELTQNQIDLLYFNLKYYVKTLADVDKLNELTTQQEQMYKTELELIKKVSKL